MTYVLVKAREMTPQRQKVYYDIPSGRHAGMGPHPLSRVANKLAYPQLREMGWTNQADPKYGPTAERLRDLVMMQMLANPEMHDLEFVDEPMAINPEMQAAMQGMSLEDIYSQIPAPGEDHAGFMTPRQQRDAERANLMRTGTRQVQTLAGKAGQSQKLQAMQNRAQAKNAESFGFPMPEEAQGLFDEEGKLNTSMPAPDMSATARAAETPAAETPAADPVKEMLSTLSADQLRQLLAASGLSMPQSAAPKLRDPGEGGSDDMFGKASQQFRTHRAAFNDAWSLMKFSPRGHHYVSPTGYGKDGYPNCRYCGSPNIEEVFDDYGNMNPVCMDCHMKRYEY